MTIRFLDSFLRLGKFGRKMCEKNCTKFITDNVGIEVPINVSKLTILKPRDASSMIASNNDTFLRFLGAQLIKPYKILKTVPKKNCS